MHPGKDVYRSETDAVKGWSERYRVKSEKVEHGAFVYTAIKKGERIYYTGKTYAGMGSFWFIRPNVVIPFIFMYVFQSLMQLLLYRAHLSSFIHTHPKPDKGYTYRYHSKEDLFLLRLPAIKAVYVIPYENNEINRHPPV